MFGSYVIDHLGFLGIIDRPGAIGQVRAMARSDARRSAQDAEPVRARPDRGRRGPHVAQALSDLDGVPLAEDHAGPDVLARVQAPGLAWQLAGRACPLPSALEFASAWVDTSETMEGGTST